MCGQGWRNQKILPTLNTCYFFFFTSGTCSLHIVATTPQKVLHWYNYITSSSRGGHWGREWFCALSGQSVSVRVGSEVFATLLLFKSVRLVHIEAEHTPSVSGLFLCIFLLNPPQWQWAHERRKVGVKSKQNTESLLSMNNIEICLTTASKIQVK